MPTTARITTLATLTTLALTSSTLAQSIANGDLTGPVVAGNAPPSWFNWQKTPDTCDASGPFNNTTTPWTLSPNGGTFVRAGGSDFANSEGFAQNVSGFTIGDTYQLDFHLTNLGFQNLASGAWNGQDGYWQLVANGAVVGDSITLSKQSLPTDPIVWFTDSISFVATASAIELALVSRSLDPTGPASYMGIDGIRVSRVPAPGALAIAAMSGLAIARRRRA
ncbi:MAG: hypothetical protein AAGD00_08325 [Planctomycetota bacterium]